MPLQPQTSLMGADANTATPQTSQAPEQLNPYKMGNQTQMLQQTGMPTSQAVTKAASNPNNRYAQGGIVPPPTPSEIEQKEASTKFNPKTLEAASAAITGEAALKNQKVDLESQANPEPFHDKLTPSDKEMLNMFDGMTHPQEKAKGGDVHSAIKDMPLKEVIKMLASHPDVGGMAKGGPVKPNMKSEAKSHGMGLLNMNADVGTYAQGGKVNAPPIQTYTPQIPAGTQQQQSGPVPSIGMASGGAVEEDNITGYGPDGTPIIENDDGTTQYGNVNSLLGRPSSAPVLGTGQTPASGVSKNAANSVAGAMPANQMAKGGEEGPPPGALSKEVADDVPAKLSEGEFVFSADVVRYYGLRLLNGMMEHARQSLKGMENEGNIRSPGDDKNSPMDDQGSMAAFMQDAKPDLSTYDEEGGNKGEQPQDADDPTGILKECMGGGMAKGGMCGYAMGGVVHAEEDFAKGGPVKQPMPMGRDNMVSSHPKGGSPLMDYAKGGIVTPKSSNLTPKKFSSDIPSTSIKISKPTGIEVPKIHSKPIGLPHMKKGGGMMIKNMMPPVVPTQSVIGS